MKKINFITNLNPELVSGGWGGINSRMYQQLKRFFCVHYTGPINPAVMPDEKLFSKLKRMTGTKGKFFFFSERRLNRISRIVSQKKEPDATWDFYFGQTSWINCRVDRPFVVYLDASFPTYMEVYSNRQEFLENDIQRISDQEASWLGKAHIVFYGSNWAMNAALKQYRMESGKQKHLVINTGGNIRIPEQDSYDIRKNELSLLFISLNFEKKGGLTCWESFKILKNNFPSATLTIIGQKPPEVVLNTPGVLYAGLLDKNKPNEYEIINEHFCKASFLVHPTRMDTMGAVILEAGYFGCPAIAPALFGIPDLIKDNVTGFLLQDGFTATDIADRIAQTWNNKEQYSTMRRQCRLFTTGELSWDAIGEKMFYHLRDL